MNEALFPTKGNLIAAEKSLALAKVGYELMDRKRSILVRELMLLLESAKGLQNDINESFAQAYEALQKANMATGFCADIAQATGEEDGLKTASRSVMGVELPIVRLKERAFLLPFGMTTSNSMLDETYIKFTQVKKMCVRLAETENSIYRLAEGIKKTQKRANALKNIIIPRYTEAIKLISDALEEKDREEFARLKVIKAGKEEH